jgi:hypothetical protein
MHYAVFTGNIGRYHRGVLYFKRIAPANWQRRTLEAGPFGLLQQGLT